MAASPRWGDGVAGSLVKIVVLSVVAALAVWAALPLISAGDWIGLGIVVVVTAILFYVYLMPGQLPAKYLIPGTLLLVAFQVVPVLFTISTATTNFGDGHRGDKSDTIAFLEATSVEQVEGAPSYALTPALDGGEVVFLLTDEQGEHFVGDHEGLSPLDSGSVVAGATGKITEVEGYIPLTGDQIAEYDEDISHLAVPTEAGGIRATGLSSAFEGRPTRQYDSECDCITDVNSGQQWFADEDNGQFVSRDGEALPQGWQVSVGLSHFFKVVTDPDIRASFLSVLGWNLLFASASVLLTFALGLACAVALHHPRLSGRKIYRAVIVLPYAMPAFGMLLVWRDMFNADYGLLNSLLGLDISWFGDAWTARLAIIVINLWLGFPYMFLIATGALQAIPRDALDAATIDGATAWQRFRAVTLPLVLVALTPLLISSFALNFNNFNVIELTTKGAPYESGSAAAGSTDLLITYTYSIAFGGQGADYGFAAAISVFIFLIVAVISAVSFRTTKQHEEVYR